MAIKIIRWINLEKFYDIIINYKDYIKVSEHALDHLSSAQRKIFKESELVNILTKERPQAIGLQENLRYSTFFKKNGDI